MDVVEILNRVFIKNALAVKNVAEFQFSKQRKIRLTFCVYKRFTKQTAILDIFKSIRNNFFLYYDFQSCLL